MKRINLCLNDKDYEKLKILSIITGLSMARVLLLSPFKRDLSAYQQRRLIRRLKRSDIRAMVAFNRKLIGDNIKEIHDRCQSKEKPLSSI